MKNAFGRLCSILDTVKEKTKKGINKNKRLEKKRDAYDVMMMIIIIIIKGTHSPYILIINC